MSPDHSSPDVGNQFEALNQQEALNVIQSVLDGLSANIALVDEKGGIIFVNRAWQDFT